MNSEKRKRELLKEIIIRLSRQEPAEPLVREFKHHYSTVTMEDIVASSGDLEQEGLKVKDYTLLERQLFDLLKEKLPKENIPDLPAGHPIRTFRDENRAILELMGKAENLRSKPETFDTLTSDWLLLAKTFRDINKHYLRKENQLFPFLEKYGFTHPSTVMWAVHDEIRKMIKTFRQTVEDKDREGAMEVLDRLIREIRDMVQKEEMILFPTALKLLNENDWKNIRQGEAEIGYALITPPGGEENESVSPPAGPEVGTERKREPAPPAVDSRAGFGEQGHFTPDIGAMSLDEGYLTPYQVNLLFQHFPFDVTFVNEKDEVVFYNKGEKRVFPRSSGIIGRAVAYCHPPKSVDIVLRILEAFKKGEKDQAEFWINLEGRFVYIQYFAVRDHSGTYRGVLEITYDATRIRGLRGEQRLLDWGK